MVPSEWIIKENDDVGKKSGDVSMPPPPLWKEVIGLTIELGTLRQELLSSIQGIHEELAVVRTQTHRPLEIAESLQGQTQVLQEELSNALRTISSQQVDIDHIKRTLKSDARQSVHKMRKEEALKEESASKEARLGEIKSTLETYSFAKRDEVDKLRNTTRLALHKAQSSADELQRLHQEVETMIRAEVKKLAQDRVTLGHLTQLKKQVTDEVDKMIKLNRKADERRMHTVSAVNGTVAKPRFGEEDINIMNEVSGLVSACHEEVESIRSDLDTFRQAHQNSFDQSVETFSKIDSVLNDVTNRTRESFAQIDIVGTKVQDVREEMRRSYSELRGKVDQINLVVESQVEGIGNLLNDIGCKHFPK